eukprot:TRINITY_DN84564_c0_g1_i1.p1 TRINITY_DN84564_c0_g1~~TRINITY_DN84564_c0_g1_i1.p1  ORF type:complete len:668 (-),score=88.65 TRINITY_DN84564_c0_g1_i1:177-1991(-)
MPPPGVIHHQHAALMHSYQVALEQMETSKQQWQCEWATREKQFQQTEEAYVDKLQCLQRMLVDKDLQCKQLLNTVEGDKQQYQKEHERGMKEIRKQEKQLKKEMARLQEERKKVLQQKKMQVEAYDNEYNKIQRQRDNMVTQQLQQPQTEQPQLQQNPTSGLPAGEVLAAGSPMELWQQLESRRVHTEQERALLHTEREKLNAELKRVRNREKAIKKKLQKRSASSSPTKQTTRPCTKSHEEEKQPTTTPRSTHGQRQAPSSPEVQQLRKSPVPGVTSMFDGPPSPSSKVNAAAVGHERASTNLAVMGQKLGVPQLCFDSNGTCAIQLPNNVTLVITYDKSTERLFMYSPVCTTLPKEKHVRLVFLEALLEGSMLGVNVAGGSLGLSMRDGGFIMLSTSIMVPHAKSTTLADLVPGFIQSVTSWREYTTQMLAGLTGMSTSKQKDNTVATSEPEEPHVVNNGNGTPTSSVSSTPCSSSNSSVAEPPPPPQPMIMMPLGSTQKKHYAEYRPDSPPMEVLPGITFVDGMYGPHHDYGPVVRQVKTPNAKASGLKRRDVLKRLNGVPVNCLANLNAKSQMLRPGCPVQLTVDRGGVEQIVILRPLTH